MRHKRSAIEPISELAATLTTGVDTLKLELSQTQIDTLLNYVHLLDRWNKTYNLTAVPSLEAMIPYHLLDSLAVAPYIDQDSILDVGSGAGLPGIPLAIVYPEKRFTLLDSKTKKTRFISQVKYELKLDNIDVITARVEDLDNTKTFDLIISRAFAEMALMIQRVRHLLSPGGCIAAMKGPQSGHELAGVADDITALRTYSLKVPLLERERRLLVFKLQDKYK